MTGTCRKHGVLHDQCTKCEDEYEKRRAPPSEISDERILEIAHRKAWRYKRSSDPNHSDTYTFNRACLLDFARAVLKEAGE